MSGLPDWIGLGLRVDYHALIGGPVTKPDLEITALQRGASGRWVAWLKGHRGCVACEALSPVGEPHRRYVPGLPKET